MLGRRFEANLPTIKKTFKKQKQIADAGSKAESGSNSGAGPAEAAEQQEQEPAAVAEQQAQGPAAVAEQQEQERQAW